MPEFGAVPVKNGFEVQFVHDLIEEGVGVEVVWIVVSEAAFSNLVDVGTGFYGRIEGGVGVIVCRDAVIE